MIIRALATATAIVGSAGMAAAQDVAAGEVVFRQCAICHSIGPGAQNKDRPRVERS
jgi:cytochrome c